MVRQRSTSQTYNHRWHCITYCVTSSEKCLNFTHWNRRVIKTRWPSVECITTSPPQWRQRETVVWLVLGGSPELHLIDRGRLFKRRQNDLAATASRATSNVSTCSSWSYTTMYHGCTGRLRSALLEYTHDCMHNQVERPGNALLVTFELVKSRLKNDSNWYLQWSMVLKNTNTRSQLEEDV